MENFTLFPEILRTDKPQTITIKQAFEAIQTGGRDGTLKTLISKIRTKATKDERNEFKKKLPCLCFSGIFTKRGKKDIVNHSGLICLDFDDVPQEQHKEFADKMIVDEFVRMLFVSPSGTGFKVVVAIPANIEMHVQYFQGLVEHFNSQYLDLAAKDVSRICFASYDEFVYLNLNSKEFTTAVDLSKRALPSQSGAQVSMELMDSSEALKLIHKWTNKDVLYGPGEKHNHLLKFAGKANRAGINMDETIQYYEFNTDKSDVQKIVSNIYKNYAHEFNTTPITTTQRKGQPQRAEGEKPQESYLTFWSVGESKKGGLVPIFSRQLFMKWLVLAGWGRYHYSGKDWELTQCKKNIVQKRSKSDLKSFVFDYIKTLPERFDAIHQDALTEMIMRGASSFFSNEYLEFLPVVEISAHMDTIDVCWLYYQNTAVKITKHDDAQVIPFGAIGHKIWEAQILQRDFILDGSMDNDFQDFILIIAGWMKQETMTPKFQNRLDAFEVALGYMMHGYKDRSKAKAVILNDAFNPTDDPRGGTGKGLFMRALQSMKETVVEDGKTWDPLKTFAYQKIQPSTQIMAVDDVRKNFLFDLLFSLVTEGATVEKKGMDAYKIPFEHSPKLLILTNYPVQGEGSSHERRRHELELDDYFINNPPLQYFGRMLFDDWSVKQWQSFDRYMIFCIRKFLLKGLITLNIDNLKIRRLRELTHPVFIDWITEFIEPKRYAFSHLHNSLSNYNNDFVKYGQGKITKWVKKFADFYGMEYKDKVRVKHEGQSLQGIEFTTLGTLKVVTSGNSTTEVVKDGNPDLKTNDEILDNLPLPF